MIPLLWNCRDGLSGNLSVRTKWFWLECSISKCFWLICPGVVLSWWGDWQKMSRFYLGNCQFWLSSRSGCRLQQYKSCTICIQRWVQRSGLAPSHEMLNPFAFCSETRWYVVGEWKVCIALLISSLSFSIKNLFTGVACRCQSWLVKALFPLSHSLELCSYLKIMVKIRKRICGYSVSRGNVLECKMSIVIKV